MKINDNVYFVYAGDNNAAEKFGKNLKGMSIRSKKNEVEDVAKIASRLVEKTCLDDHLYEEEKKSVEERLPPGKRTTENVPCVLNIILAGKCSSSPSGYAMYTIDDTKKGCYEARKVTIAFGGSGKDLARKFAIDNDFVSTTNGDEIDETKKKLALNDALNFVKNTIMTATHKDWRSGGRIHLLILNEKRNPMVMSSRKKKTMKKNAEPIRIVYNQTKPKYCRCPYLLTKLDFEVKCPHPTDYPDSWKLEQLDEKLLNLRLRVKTDFDDDERKPGK